MDGPGRRPRPRPPIVVQPAPPPVLAPPDIDSTATLTVGEQTIECNAGDLESLMELGRGAYGVVEKMRHRPTNTIMAVKRITATVNTVEQKRLLMDLDVSMRSASCPYAVHFYGAMFLEGDVWICMEVMDTSLDKFYKKVYGNGKVIPEAFLSKMAYSVVEALLFLKEKLKVIHRDVKPSNILANKKGEIKICDFGISGQLVDSVAKTMDAGCKPYMAKDYKLRPYYESLLQQPFIVAASQHDLDMGAYLTDMLALPDTQYSGRLPPPPGSARH